MKKFFAGLALGLVFAALPAGAYYLGYFVDVKEGQWFTETIEFLASRGILNGYEDGTFQPANTVNRAEVSAIVTRAMAEMGHEGAVCIAPPYVVETGRFRYPVLYRYKAFPWLGALFTAAGCGDERLDAFFGGKDGAYDYGSRLTLRKPAHPDLETLLRQIGYQCEDDVAGDGAAAEGGEFRCNVWLLGRRDVPVRDVLQLETWSHYFLRDDCINCG